MDMDAFGKSLHFHYVAESISCGEEIGTTPNTRAYVDTVRNILTRTSQDLGRILNQEPYKNIDGDTVGIVRALGYRTQSELSESARLLREMKAELSRSSENLGKLSSAPQEFYRDEVAAQNLHKICATIDGYFYSIYERTAKRDLGIEIAGLDTIALF